MPDQSKNQDGYRDNEPDQCAGGSVWAVLLFLPLDRLEPQI